MFAALVGITWAVLPGVVPPLAGQIQSSPLLRRPFESPPSDERWAFRGGSGTVAYRSHLPVDANNGALWAGRGVSSLIRVEGAAHLGPLHVTVGPEVHASQNSAFEIVPAHILDFSPFTSPWFPLDHVQRMGTEAVRGVEPGQTTVEVGTGAMAVGFSTANLVRGPEARYPLVWSATGPGVPRVFVQFGGVVPRVGDVWAHVTWGELRESEWFDQEPANDRTLLTGVFLDWAPAFAPGLIVGGSFTYRDPIEDGLRFAQLFKFLGAEANQGAAERAEDALAAVHLLWESDPLAVWVTWGRGDYFENAEDLFTEPDHVPLSAVGARLAWSLDGRPTELLIERASTALSNSRALDALTAYRHAEAIQGHTHRGQPLGASVGAGSEGTFLSVSTALPDLRLSANVEHLVHDKDVYRRVFDRRDGPQGQDREWRFGGGVGRTFPRVIGRLDVDLSYGVARRWHRLHRQYVPEFQDAPAAEWNAWMDLTWSWRPEGD